MKNYYPILGLHNFETNAELIKSKYLEKLEYYNPNSNNVAEDVAKAKTIEINEAYTFLGNPDYKLEYDKSLYNLIYGNNAETEQEEGPSQLDDEQVNLTLIKGKKESIRWKALILVLLIIIPLVVVIKENKGIKTSNPITILSVFDSDSKLTPIQVSNGEIIKKPLGRCIAPFQVNVWSMKNCYIVLENENDPSNSMSFYANGGNSVKINVPLGRYKLYYASGRTWYGEEELFGKETIFTKCNTTLDFNISSNVINGREITINSGTSGNMTSQNINKSQFPKV